MLGEMPPGGGARNRNRPCTLICHRLEEGDSPRAGWMGWTDELAGVEFTIILVLVYRVCVWNGKLYDILIRDTYGPVSTPRIQGMSSVRILRNDGTVVVLLGRRTFQSGLVGFRSPLVSQQIQTVIVSRKLFNREGCQITVEKSEDGSKFRSCDLTTCDLTTFTCLVNCVLIRFLSTFVPMVFMVSRAL